MEPSVDRFQRSSVNWIISIFMLLLPLPVFWFFYPRSGFENSNKGLIYLLFFALSLFLYGFYRTFLAPYTVQIQNNGFLVVKSLLFPKVVAITEIQSVQVTDNERGNDPAEVVYTILLKDGDPIEMPSLAHMTRFIEKLTTQYPQIEIEYDQTLKAKD